MSVFGRGRGLSFFSNTEPGFNVNSLFKIQKIGRGQGLGFTPIIITENERFKDKEIEKCVQSVNDEQRLGQNVHQEQNAKFPERVEHLEGSVPSGDTKEKSTNVVRMKILTTKEIFNYRVDFFPAIAEMYEKKANIMMCLENIGDVFMFNGGTLYIPKKLEENETEIRGKNVETEEALRIKLTFVKKLSDAACSQVTRILFKKLLNVLNLIQIGNEMFDPRRTRQIANEKLEIWRGFRYSHKEDTIKLKFVDKILQRETAYDMLSKIRSSGNPDICSQYKDAIIGRMVITEHTNATYVIDDINFDMTPESTFTRRGEETTFQDYYLNTYGLRIEHLEQPLLISNVRTGEDSSFVAHLIPEHCNMFGLTKDQETRLDDNKLTNITLDEYIEEVETWIKSWEKIEPAVCHIKDWGLKMSVLRAD